MVHRYGATLYLMSLLWQYCCLVSPVSTEYHSRTLKKVINNCVGMPARSTTNGS